MMGLGKGGLTGGAALLVAGVATGIAIEKAVVGRRINKRRLGEREPFGELRGRSVEVISTDGVALHVDVEERGDPDHDGNLTVIFCHGYGLNQHCWHYQRRDLRALGQLVFVDQRAHGRSGRGDPSNTTVDQLGEDVKSVIDQVTGEDPLLLVGHSMGGMMVMALAADHPELFTERIVGVALLATSAGGMADESFGLPPRISKAFHRLLPQALNSMSQRTEIMGLRPQMSDIEFLITSRYGFGPDAPLSLTEFTSQMIKDTPLDVLAEFFPAIDEHDKREAIAVLAGIETLVMVGSKDLLTPPHHSDEIVRLAPHAEFILLPDTGHMLMLERYPEVNQGLRDLVGRIRSAGVLD